ncbi:unnamed protein product, partial [marine sediment metagenome]
LCKHAYYPSFIKAKSCWGQGANPDYGHGTTLDGK